MKIDKHLPEYPCTFLFPVEYAKEYFQIIDNYILYLEKS